MRAVFFSVILACWLAGSALGASLKFQGISAAYRSEVMADRVTVRYTDDAGTRAETYTVRVNPEGAALIEFGELRAYVTENVLVVTPENDRRRAFVTPVFGSVSQTLAEHLPGVPAWQAIALLDDADAAEKAWPLDRAASTPVVITGDKGRLRFASVDLGEGRGVRLSVEAVEPGDPSEWIDDLRGRRRVRDVASLTAPATIPHTDAVRIGDEAPSLLLLTLESAPWILEARDAGAVALVLCREQTPGAAAGYGAALDVAEDKDAPLGFTAAIGVCTPPFEGRSAAHLEELRRRWGESVLWSVSTETTIDRFAPGAKAVLVVIDAFDSVRAIVPLDGRGGDQGELAEEIRGALRGG